MKNLKPKKAIFLITVLTLILTVVGFYIPFFRVNGFTLDGEILNNMIEMAATKSATGLIGAMMLIFFVKTIIPFSKMILESIRETNLSEEVGKEIAAGASVVAIVGLSIPLILILMFLSVVILIISIIMPVILMILDVNIGIISVVFISNISSCISMIFWIAYMVEYMGEGKGSERDKRKDEITKNVSNRMSYFIALMHFAIVGTLLSLPLIL